jgi:hypothetical protein
MSKKKRKIVFIADEPEEDARARDGWISFYFCQNNLKPVLHPEKTIDWHFLSLQCGIAHSNVIDEIRSLIRGADCVMFDYGGFSMPGQDNSRLIDFYTREFTKLIKDNPSIDWWCVSNLPANCFSDDEKEELKGICKFYWDE